MLSQVNIIIRLMWSQFKITFTKAYYTKTIGYCYHSVNVITFGLAKRDHIKRLPLYIGFLAIQGGYVSEKSHTSNNKTHILGSNKAQKSSFPRLLTRATCANSRKTHTGEKAT